MGITSLVPSSSFDQAMAVANQRKSESLTKIDTENLPSNIDEINATAKDFEAVFISEMINHMFEGVKTDSTFGGGQGEDMARSMMINEYGKSISERGGIGIAKYIARELIDIQESANANK